MPNKQTAESDIVPWYHDIVCYHTAAMMTGPAGRRPSPAGMHQTAVQEHYDDDDDVDTDSRLSVDVMTAHSR